MESAAVAYFRPMIRILPVLGLLAVLVACHSPGPSEPVALPNDFQVFYELFHRDSSYQMDHIRFPLEGLPDYADSATIAAGTFHWEQVDWVLHRRELLNDPSFERQLNILTDFLVTERFVHKDRPLMTERRFMREPDGWYLIYYAGLNTYHQVGAHQ